MQPDADGDLDYREISQCLQLAIAARRMAYNRVVTITGDGAIVCPYSQQPLSKQDYAAFNEAMDQASVCFNCMAANDEILYVKNNFTQFTDCFPDAENGRVIIRIRRNGERS